MPVLDFLAVRFVIAAVVMAVVFRRQVRRLPRRPCLRGLGLGVVYGLAQILQTEGLARTSASVSGFVTGMYVVLTPVLGPVLLRQRPAGSTWVAVVLSTAGLAVLSLRGAQVERRRAADPGLGRRSTPCTSSASASGRRRDTPSGWPPCRCWPSPPSAPSARYRAGSPCRRTPAPGPATLYTALGAGALAMFLQTWAQAHLPATRAAIVMTMEPVAAAGFAVAFGASR